MSVDSIEKLFVEELRDLYSSENQITKALPKMAKAATSAELRSAFEEHLEETQGHAERLETICEALGVNPKGKTCDGMEGIIDEGEEMLKEAEKGDIRDAALISAAQRVEHYEMAAYGSVRTYAERLGNSEAVRLLEATLEEEKGADRKLTEIAKKVQQQALRAA